MLRLFICSCLLVCAVFFGCSDQKTKKTPVKKRAPELVKRPKLEQAEALRPENATLLPMEELLAKKDISDEAKSRLRQLKLNGVKSLKSSAFDILLDQHDLNVAIENRLKNGWPATKSEYETPLEFQYDSKPTRYVDWLDQRQQFFAMPIEHFRKQEFSDKNSDSQKRAADLMRQVICTGGKRRPIEYWEQLRQELSGIGRTFHKLNGDPLFQHCMGIIEFRLGDVNKAYSTLQRACNFYATSSYPARALVHARLLVIYAEKRMTKQAFRIRNLARCYVAIKYWLEKDFRATPEEHRFAGIVLDEFMEHLENTGELELLDRFMKIVDQGKHLPVWVRSYLKGEYYSDIAWRNRGYGWANTVSEEAWKVFEVNQKLASKHYTEAYEANPMFPEAASALLGISNTGHNDQSEEYWYEKATDAQFDHYPTNWSRLISLLPQWGGSVEEMLEFAESRAGKNEGQNPLPYTMVQCYYCAAKYVFDAEGMKYFHKEENVEKVFQALDKLIDEDQSLLLGGAIRGRTTFLTQKAIVAFNANRNEVARKAFDDLDGEFDADMLNGLTRYGEDVIRGRIYAMTDEVIGKECQEFYDLYQKGFVRNGLNRNSEEIISIGSGLLEKTNNEYAKSWIRRLRDKTQFESDYDVGLTATLPFDRGLTLWQFDDESQFVYESEDSILIDNTDSFETIRGVSFLSCRGAKTIEFDFEFLESSATSTEKVSFTPSVTVLNYRGSAFSFGLNRLYARGNKKPPHVFDLAQLTFGYRDGDNAQYFYTVELEEISNRMRIRATSGYFEVFLNDRFVFRSSSQEIRGVESVFEVCQPKSRRGRGKVRLSGVRIEKWTSSPPPVNGTADELIEYYENEKELAPDDKWIQFCLSQATHQNKQFKRAIDLYRDSIVLGMNVEEVAFFIGDCHDRLGETKKAIEWYKKAAKASLENVNVLYPRMTQRGYSNSCHWASFRLAWMKHVHSEELTRNDLAEFESCRSDLPINSSWAVGLLDAIDRAAGSASDASSDIEDHFRKVLSACPEEFKPTLKATIDGFKNNGLHCINEGDEPIYLKFENPIPFFRCFEDYLDPAWNGVY